MDKNIGWFGGGPASMTMPMMGPSKYDGERMMTMDGSDCWGVEYSCLTCHRAAEMQWNPAEKAAHVNALSAVRQNPANPPL